MRRPFSGLISRFRKTEEPRFLLEVSGFCPVCETDTKFISHDAWLRDHFKCVNCRSIPRERALIAVLDMYFPNWRTLKIHESSPAMSASKKLRREAKDYTASFFMPGVELGHPLETLKARNEDLERQTFADETFDLVITQDVFEHLFRPDLAIAEIARTLKPGGAHVCTVPICLKNSPSGRRARLEEDGTIEHLAEPVYHGNPIDEAGSLVTMDYGYDVADYFDKASGLNTTIVLLEDLSRGIRAEYLEVLVSCKPSRPFRRDE